MTNPWQHRRGDVVVRHPRPAEMQPTIVSSPAPRRSKRNFASPSALFLGIILLIFLGTVLLILPVSNTINEHTPFLTALFTSTSAVTVTGLVVKESSSYWSPIGQAIILGLILIGGMGWMTVAGFILILIRHRVSLSQRMLLREHVGNSHIGQVTTTLGRAVTTFLIFQMIGGAILTVRFHESFGMNWEQAAWQGLFHAISGFNNAGFTIIPNSQSLSIFYGDFLVIGVMTVLIILGGLSFPVLSEIFRLRNFRLYGLDTKFVTLWSLVLWILGTLVIFFSERQNIFGSMNTSQQFMNSIFHSVSARAAGFSTVEISLLTDTVGFFLIGLMFIGTASASVGGGIRLNTFGVLLSTIFAAVKGKESVTAFRREISPEQVQRAIAVWGLASMFIFIATILLTFTEFTSRDFINLLFETVSAIGTVGLTRETTSGLSDLGQILIILLMLLGRLGPLMLGVYLADRELHAPLFRYARERVNIG